MPYKTPGTIHITKQTEERLDRIRSSSGKTWDEFLNWVINMLYYCKQNHK